MIDFERDRVDLAIRYFNGKDPTLDVALLCSDEARLYCSPEYAAKLHLKRQMTCVEPPCCTQRCSRIGYRGFGSSAR